MGRRLHYVPGSFYRTDDRTGFPTRAERTKKEWNGYIVGEKYWEPRQPQDLVKGVPDFQSVPEARPLAPNQYIGPIFIQLTANVGPGGTIIPLQTVGGVTPGDEIGIVLDNGIIWNAVVLEILPDAEVLISRPLPATAPSGNLLVDYRINVGVPPVKVLETEGGLVITTEDGQPLEIEL